MRKLNGLIVFFISVTITMGAGRSAQSPRYEHVPGQVVIKMASENSSPVLLHELAGKIALEKGLNTAVKALYSGYQFKSPETAKLVGLNRLFVVQVQADENIPELCRQLQQNPAVEYAEPVYIIPQDAIPNDPRYNEQSHLPQIMAPAAWDVAKGSPTVPIAIIDSGVDWKHPDLKDVIWTNPGEDVNHDGVITAADSNGVDNDHNGFIDDFHGWDFVTGVSGTGESNAAPDEDGETPDNDPMDVNGHGSHCAGLAAAATNNNIGVAGVSWGCQIMPIRIGWLANDGNGYGYSTTMAQGFIYAADNGAKVANLSYGTSAAVLDGARYAYLHDVAVVTSAGNSQTEASDALSVQPWAITVAAVDPNDVIAWYSNYGFHVKVAAPGGDHQPGLLSTTPNNSHNNNSYYNNYSGTSMASPVTAGVLGLIRSQHPEWNVVKAYYQLVGTADNIDSKNPQYKGQLGSGRINAYRALTETVIPAPKIAFKGINFFDPAGNNNGLVEPGEEIDIVFHLQNYWAPCSNAKAKLISNDPRLSIKTNQVTLDTLYGLDDYELDNNNLSNPLKVQIAADLLPCMLPAQLVIETQASSDTFAFEIPVHPLVLLVEDNHAGGDGTDLPIAHYYIEAFRNLGVTYEYWHNLEPLDSNYILKFPIIVWGCEWAFPSLDENDRAILKKYLEQGGNLFISGQDIAWDLSDMTSTSNQWKVSNGASKYFFEKYLAASYVSDDGGKSPLSVAAGAFFDLPDFEFEQPDRPGNKYPDVVLPRPNEGGYALLNHANGTCAAVGADSPYHTVYFAFGGFEAIKDPQIRTSAMQQILNHFTRLQVAVQELRNTEYKGPFTVTAKLNTTKNIAAAKLVYRYDDGEWMTLPMTVGAEGVYEAVIPAVTAESAIVSYYVFVKATDGTYYADQQHQFYTGPDREKPVATPVVIPFDSIDRLGPYQVTFAIEDNIAVDTSHVYLHYFSTTQPEDSVALTYYDAGQWMGTFQFTTPVNDGDSVYFYLSFRDLGALPNHARLPETGYYKFSIQNKIMVDNFEAGLGKWNNENNFWGIYTNPSAMKDGIRCLVSGDGVKYKPEENASILYKNQFNLSSRTRANVRFIYVHLFDSAGDSVFFEIQVGNNPWKTLHKFYGANVSKWTEKVFDLSEYCGSGKEPISLRFRFKSDATAGAKVGLLIDRLELLTDEAVGIAENIPRPFVFQTQPAYPNPFNATITIPFSLPEKGVVELRIYDLLGRNVYYQRQEFAQAGQYQLQWYGYNDQHQYLASGIYFAQLRFRDQVKWQKIVMTK